MGGFSADLGCSAAGDEVQGVYRIAIANQLCRPLVFGYQLAIDPNNNQWKRPAFGCEQLFDAQLSVRGAETFTDVVKYDGHGGISIEPVKSGCCAALY